MVWSRRLAFVLSTFALISQSWAQGVPELLPFQGRLTDAATGNPTNYTTQVKFRIYPPTGNCYLYEDTQSVTPNNYGMFAVVLGAAGNSSGPGNAFSTVFNNSAASINDSCSGTYTPTANDWRRIEIVVDGVAMAQMQTIGASAYALQSKNASALGGKLANQFIQVTGGVTQPNMQTLVGGGDASSLHNHDSTYARIDGSNSYSGNIQTTSGIYTTNGAVGIGTTSAAADLEIDKAAPSMRLSATSGGGGVPKIDFFSGATTQRASIRSSETTNELRMYTGSTEALRLDANQNAFFAGSMVVAGTVGLGRYTNAQEPTLLTALTAQGATAAGTMWVNTTTGTIKYWNGTAAQSVLGTGGSYVNTVTAGTGITISGTATDPVINVAPVVLAGDVSGTSGATTVTKIRGTNVNVTSLAAQDILQYNGTSWVNAPIPTCAAGQYVTYNGTSWSCGNASAGSVTSVGISVPSYMTASGGPVTSSGSIALGFGSQTAKTVFAAPSGAAGAPSFRTLNIADVQSTVAGSFLTGAGCAAGQALTYNSINDTISCSSVVPSVSNSATLASAKIWVGDASNKAQEVTVSGDATLSGAGVVILANSGAAAGTYSKVTVDAKGRVTSGANIAAADVTTALGYTPLNKAGDVMGGALGLNAVASDPAGLVAADKGKVWYNTTSSQVKYWDGSAAQPLGIAGSGMTSLNGQSGSTQTFATGTSGTDFAISSASNTHTFNLPSSSASARGLLTSADWTTFNNKLGTSTVLAGDVSGTYNATSVEKIKGKSVTPAAYSAGQTLRYDGVQWVNAALGFSDIASKPTTLSGYGITDAVSTTLTNGNILVGNGSNVATAVTVSGDAALSNAGVLTLANTAVSAGAYGSASAVPTFTVDGKGRMIVAASTAYQDATGAAKGIVQVGSNISVASGVISITAGNVSGALGFTPLNKAGDVMGGALGLNAVASDPAGLVAADKGKVWYNTTSSQIKYWDGSAAQPLGIAGSGLTSLNGQSGSSQTFATGTSGTDFAISSSGNTHTFNVPDASASARGALTSADWTAFNNKLGTTTSFTGDVSGNYNSTSVDKIKGKAVTPVAYSAGQTLRYDGTQWVNAALSFSDIASKPTTLSGYGITDGLSTTLANGKILVGNGSNVATAVTMSGDAAMSNAGVLTLTDTSVAVGTYGSASAVPSFTVDSKGRLTAAGSAAYADATAVSKGIVQVGSNINVSSGVISINGTSVTGALGYTPLNKAGDTMGGTLAMGGNDIAGAGNITLSASKYLGVGQYSSDPSTAGWGAAEKGRTWFNTTTNSLKYWDGSAVQGVGAGAVTSVTASAPLSSSGGTTPNITLSQANGSTSGYLSSTDWTTFNNKLGTGTNFAGDVSGAYNALSVDKIKGTTVTISSLTSGNFLKYNGSAWVNANLDTSDLGSGTLPIARGGTNSSTALTNNQLMVSSAGKIVEAGAMTDGQIVVGKTAAAPQIVTLGGDATVSNTGSLTLANTAVSAGSYGSSSAVPSFTVDSKGRLTAAASSAYQDATGAAKGIVQVGSNISVSSGVISLSSGNVTGALGFTPLNKAGDVMSGNFGLNAVASDPAGLVAADKGKMWYNTTSSQIKYWDGSAAQALGVAGSGLTSLNGQSGSSQTFATGTSGTDFAISSSGNTHTFNLPSASASARGLLTSADWTTFNNKLGASTVFAGDISGTYNAITLNTVPVSKGGTGLTAGGTANQVLGMNNAAGALEYKSITAGSGVTVTHAANSITIAATGSGGTVTNVTGAGPISVANGATTPAISISQANGTTSGYLSSTDWTTFNGKLGTSLSSGNIWVGNGANVATAVAVSGDAVLSNAGVLTLVDTGVTTGTYGSSTAIPSLTVDSKGRLTVAGSAAYADATAVSKGIVQVGSNINVSSGVISINGTSVTGALGYTPLNKAGDVMGGALGLNAVASDPAGLVAADKGKVWYNTTSSQIKYWDGSAAQPLGIAGSGLTSLNGQSGSTQTFATGTAGTDFAISSSGNTHTFNVPSASASARGALTSADWTTFNNKLGTTTSFTGDVSGNYNSTSVDKIKGKAVTPAAYSAGQTLRYDGTQWVNDNLTFADLASGTLPTSRLPALTGDVTSSAGSNSITLNTVSVAKGGTGLTAGGTANQILGMNNAAGAMEYKTVTAGSGITVTHAANSITIAATNGGTVTSVTGNGPISVANGATTPAISISQATNSVSGYLTSTDWTTFNNKLGTALSSANIWVGNGSNVATAVAMTGDAALSNAGALTLANTAVTAGTYGSSTGVPSFTVDSKGRLTAASAAAYADATAVSKGIVQVGSNINVSSGVISINSTSVTGALGFTPLNKAGDTMTGNLTAPAFFYSSDRRLKTDIQDIEGLEMVLRLHGVHFRWKSDGSPEIGLIAQEVESVLPELVKTDAKTGIKSVKYGNLVAPLIESTKELYSMYRSIASDHVSRKEYDNLKNSMEVLKKENEEMRNELRQIKEMLQKK